jgi:hypothetical protein
MATGKDAFTGKDAIKEAGLSRLTWILAAVLAISIGVPLAAGALLRFVF